MSYKEVMYLSFGVRLQRSNFSICRAAKTVASFRAFSSVAATENISSTIQVGDKLPEAELSFLDKENNVKKVKVSELTEGKKVVLFAVPGAFSPTCTQKHVPSFVANADELKARGIDTIGCVSTNDVFVMRAWGESLGVRDKILLLSDGNVTFTRALGVELDMTAMAMGLRSKRYALLADNGVVKHLNLEDGGGFTVSGAEKILEAL